MVMRTLIFIFLSGLTLSAQTVAPNRALLAKSVARQVSGGGADTNVITSGLIHYISSVDFDGTGNGTSVSAWNDRTAGAHNWSAPGTAPVVDGTITAGGHKTVRFNSTAANLRTAKFFTAGYSGLEIMAVFRLAADPPSADSSRVFLFTDVSGEHSEQPYSDTAWYENFGTTLRGAWDAATNAATSFVCYDIAVKSDASLYDGWMNDDHFIHGESGLYGGVSSFAYAYSGSETYYFLGDPDATYSIVGNIAAILIWNRYLGDSERTYMRNYMNTNYGTTIP